MGVSGCLVNVVSAFIAIEYMDHRFQKRYSGTRRIVWFIFAWMTYFLVVTGLNLTMKFEGLLLLSYGGVAALYGIAALEGDYNDMIKAGLAWVLILMLSAVIVYGILGIWTGQPIADLVPLEGELLLPGACAGGGLRFSMGRIVSAVFPRAGAGRKPEDWGIAAAFLLLLLGTLGVFALETGSLGREVRYGLIIAVSFLEFGVILMLESMQRRIYHYQEIQMEQEYRVREMKNLYRIGREINHWRHDMVGQLNVLHRLLKRGKAEEAAAYIEEMDTALKTYPDLPQETGNEGLDAALIKAIPRCREAGISFCYWIFGKPESIGALEFGRLMNNLLDNGIDACRQAEGEREMVLMVRSDSETGVEIYLENSIPKSVLAANPELKSRKKERVLHGFGMESIREIVRRHGGVYSCWEERGMFGQTIVLPGNK